MQPRKGRKAAEYSCIFKDILSVHLGARLADLGLHFPLNRPEVAAALESALMHHVPPVTAGKHCASIFVFAFGSHSARRCGSRQNLSRSSICWTGTGYAGIIQIVFKVFRRVCSPLAYKGLCLHRSCARVKMLSSATDGTRQLWPHMVSYDCQCLYATSHPWSAKAVVPGHSRQHLADGCTSLCAKRLSMSAT